MRKDHSKEHLNMKRVLALLFTVALSVSMSSFAFAQGDKSACKPMDKMDKPMDKKEDAKAKRHQIPQEAKERRNEERRNEERPTEISSPSFSF